MFLVVLQRKRVIVTKRKFTINVDFKIPPSVSLGWGPGICIFRMLSS